MQESQVTASSGQPRSRLAFSFRPTSGLRPLTSRRQAFTLTELLIVIAIIAVLAGLIAAAAVNALRRGRETRVTLELKNMSGAIENFKNDYGIYPPNGMTERPASTNPAAGSSAALVKADFVRAFKKAFPRHNEPNALIEALAGVTPPGGSRVSGPLEHGMRANEALYFWLGGFSADEQYPISGPGGPSFSTDPAGLGEVLEDRTKRYEFDLSRLGPRDANGVFDATKGRFLTYEINMGSGNEERRINFWQYSPSGSQQPFVYFDVSRHKPGLTNSTSSAAAGPGKYDLWAALPGTSGLPHIYALKQLREGATAVANNMNNVVFVNQGKFQLLHAGLDDDWGDAEFKPLGILTAPSQSPNNLLLYPSGPFTGPITDTLSNFADGTLESAAEQ